MFIACGSPRLFLFSSLSSRSKQVIFIHTPVTDPESQNHRCVFVAKLDTLEVHVVIDEDLSLKLLPFDVTMCLHLHSCDSS